LGFACGFAGDTIAMMLLTSTPGEVMEVLVAAGLIALIMGVMVSIPILVQYYIEERGQTSESAEE
jgi:hypothetical protein